MEDIGNNMNLEGVYKMAKEGEDHNIKPNESVTEEKYRDIQDALDSFRDTHRKKAERSVFFWKKQHEAIMQKINNPEVHPKFRLQLVWISAAALVLLCIVFFSKSVQAPIPDIAAGYDQDLLLAVDNALSRNCSTALEPVNLLAREIER